MSGSRACHACGERFQGETWQRLCWQCWRDRREADDRGEAYQRGFRDGLAAAHQQPAPQLDRDLISAAVRLCHPDRHPAERFELANKTTAALLLALQGQVAA